MRGMSPSDCLLRQPRELGIGELGLGALLHLGDGHLAAPLADLDDERDVRADRHVLQRELAGRVGERRDERRCP